MPRKSIGERPMTDAERQARRRAARAAGQPVIRTRRAADHRSRARRWTDGVAGLVELQAEYAAWLDGLPESLQDSATGEALRMICELDLSELQTIGIPPVSAADDQAFGGLRLWYSLRMRRTSSIPSSVKASTPSSSRP